jgi:hypothetical protein
MQQNGIANIKSKVAFLSNENDYKEWEMKN